MLFFVWHLLSDGTFVKKALKQDHKAAEMHNENTTALCKVDGCEDKVSLLEV